MCGCFERRGTGESGGDGPAHGKVGKEGRGRERRGEEREYIIFMYRGRKSFV